MTTETIKPRIRRYFPDAKNAKTRVQAEWGAHSPGYARKRKVFDDTLEGIRQAEIWLAGLDNQTHSSPAPADRVFDLTAGRDDETDRGQPAGTGRAASTGGEGLHAKTFDRVKNHLPGDEIVTSADRAWKLAMDIAKVSFRGYGRVIVDGVLGATFDQWIIDHGFQAVPIVRVEDA